MPKHPIRSAPPPPPMESSNNNIWANKKHQASSHTMNINNNLLKSQANSIPTVIRPTTTNKKKKAPPPRPAPPKRYQPKPDLLNHLNYTKENYVKPKIDILHNQNFQDRREGKMIVHSKNKNISDNQISDCLIDLDSPNICSTFKTNISLSPAKSLLDADNIEEVPHKPLLGTPGSKSISLLPSITTSFNTEKSNLFDYKEKFPSTEIARFDVPNMSAASSHCFSLKTSKECPGLIKKSISSERKILTALYDFFGEMEEDLSFKAGDKIVLHNEINSDWWFGEIKGKQGQFPSSFVSEMENKSSNIVSSENPPQEPKKVIALYDFVETEKGDLSFNAGDTITLLYSINSDWLYGELNGKQGQFPANFIQEEFSKKNAQAEKLEEEPPPLGVFVALYNFKAEQPGDLELHEGDRVLVTDCLNDEWWHGMITPAGTTGIFPATFVKRIEP